MLALTVFGVFSVVSFSLLATVGLVFSSERETGSFSLDTVVLSAVTGAVGVSITRPLVVRLESAASTCTLEEGVETSSALTP